MTNEPTTKTCSRCGKTFTGEIYLCVECDAELEKSEGKRADAPTTGEIVRALRYCADVNSICGDACPAHLDEAGCRTVLLETAADRLESQAEENEISRHLIEMQSNVITELTARAESAERERDAAKRDIEEIMSTHGLEVFTMCAFCAMPDDDTCFIAGDNKKCKAKWRGLQPQDGGVK